MTRKPKVSLAALNQWMEDSGLPPFDFDPHAECKRERDELRAALSAMDQAMAGHPIYETSTLQRQVQSLLGQT